MDRGSKVVQQSVREALPGKCRIGMLLENMLFENAAENSVEKFALGDVVSQNDYPMLTVLKCCAEPRRRRFRKGTHSTQVLVKVTLFETAVHEAVRKTVKKPLSRSSSKIAPPEIAILYTRLANRSKHLWSVLVDDLRYQVDSQKYTG